MGKITSANQQPVFDAAVARAISVIEKKSVMDEAHTQSIHALIKAMVEISVLPEDEFLTERMAIPMATGMGKSVSLTSFVIELLLHGYTDTSVLITTETLEEIKDIHANLLQEIPQDLHARVGVFHKLSKGERIERGIPERSEGTQGDYQIVFMAHAGIETSDDITLYNEYQGKPRDIVLWDEALIKSAGHFINHEIVASTAASFEAIVTRDKAKLADTAVVGVMNWMNKLLLTIDAHVEKLETSGDKWIQIPSHANDESLAIANEAFTNFKFKEEKVIRSLLKMATREVRLHRPVSGSSSPVLSYDTKVPDELKRVLILDASCNVRAFYRQDATMNIDERFGNLKDFSSVTLVQNKSHACGKGVLNGPPRKLKRLVDDVIEVLLSIPEEEKVLICTTKPPTNRYDKNPGILAVLEGELRRRGYEDFIDQDRVKTITWGRHKATNAYSDCSHILAIGIQRRNPHELLATTYGQTEGVPGACDDVRYISKTEQVAALQQLIGRGTARSVNNRVANECTVHLFEKEEFMDVHDGEQSLDLLQVAMPGMVVESSSGSSEGAVEAAAKELFGILDRQAPDKISAAAWTKQSPLYKGLKSKDQMTVARDKALEMTNGVYVTQGRSLVRQDF